MRRAGCIAGNGCAADTASGYSRAAEEMEELLYGSGTDWYFTPCAFASTIVQKVELGPLNKTARSFSGEMIKEICIPIQVDRLGNIIAKNND